MILHPPIALTSVVGKLFNNLANVCREMYLKANNVINTSVQKGFLTALPGVFEHIYSLSAILQDGLANKKPLMITFLELKDASSSGSHQLIFGISGYH